MQSLSPTSASQTCLQRHRTSSGHRSCSSSHRSAGSLLGRSPISSHVAAGIGCRKQSCGLCCYMSGLNIFKHGNFQVAMRELVYGRLSCPQILHLEVARIPTCRPAAPTECHCHNNGNGETPVAPPLQICRPFCTISASSTWGCQYVFVRPHTTSTRRPDRYLHPAAGSSCD
jgi:hypothetical protein